MPSFTSMAVAFVALLEMAAANPVNLLEKRKTFTVHQVEKGKVLRSLPIDMAKTYAKFGKEVPTHIQAAAAAVSGSVTAIPEDAYDSLYLSPVTVGCQTLNLDFDTGSADLWVFSSLQSSSQTSGHTIYNPSSCSTSSLKSGYTWSISYGDGSSASGKVYADKVVVGGVTATSQAVEAATSVSSSFLSDVDDDGLLGLAFSSINTVSPTSQLTFFDNVKANLASPLFAVTLKKGAAGTYDFGYIDSSKYTGSITYSSVSSSQGFWQITASGYAVGSGSSVSSSFTAIADTGTTLVYLPTAIVKAYYAKVSGSQNSNTFGGYVFPCTATLPNLSIVIAGVKQTIPGSYINYAPADSSGSTCYGGIQSNTGIGLSILGDVFLKSKYVVFENSGSSPRLGIAQQAGVSS